MIQHQENPETHHSDFSTMRLHDSIRCHLTSMCITQSGSCGCGIRQEVINIYMSQEIIRISKTCSYPDGIILAFLTLQAGYGHINELEIWPQSAVGCYKCNRETQLLMIGTVCLMMWSLG